MLRKAMRAGASAIAPLAWKRYLKDNSKKWPKGKKYAVTISFDYDYVSDVMCLRELAELFDSFELKASHAVVGKYVEKFSRDHQSVVDAGHEIINHSYSHPNGPLNPHEYFNKLGRGRMKEEIGLCEEACREVLGVKPKGFRTPHFGNLNSQQVYGILEERGYSYSSSTNLTTTQSRGVPYKPNRDDFHSTAPPHYDLLELPVFSCPYHYYSVFDSWHCFESGAHAKPGEFHAAFKKGLRLCEKHGSYFNVYFDPHHVAHLKDFARILESLRGDKHAWVATSGEVAEWWSKN